MEPRHASLRLRTLVLVALATVALSAGIYLPLDALLLDSFLQLERTSALQNLARAENAIETSQAQVAAVTRDYASWDDTFFYLEGRAPEYPSINLVGETFENNHLGLVVATDVRGRVRYAGAWDLAAHEAIDPPDVRTIVRALCPRADCQQAAGLVDTPRGPMIAAAHAVERSDGSGPSPGVLIMGRWLDAREVEKLRRVVRLDLSLRRDLDPALSEAHPRRTRVIDEAHIAASALLFDTAGEPFLAAEIVLPREVYAQGKDSTRAIGIAVVIAVLSFGIVILVLLDRVVLRRIGRLGRDVERVSASADPALRVEVRGEDELAALAAQINRMLSDLASARQVIRAAFGRYVSEEVAREILSRPAGAELGGQTREVTILFSDLRSYSTITEKMPPAEVVELLNEYFGAMSEVVVAHGGVVIEFLGDAILAVFGAPADLAEHAGAAVRAALAIEARGEELNRAWEASGRAALWKAHGIEALRSRIGVHSGRVVVGNLGNQTRMKYGVIGDAVNTAARVQTLNDALGTFVLLTADVRERLDDALRARLEDRGEHTVKGRERAVHVYTVR